MFVRPATVDDIDRLLFIEKHSFESDQISRRSFRSLMASDTARIIVIEREEDDELVGYAVVLFRQKTALARLYSIAVMKETARSGAGSMLLREAERVAFEEGRVFMRLEVREDNERAIALYKRFHYRPIGKYLKYYNNRIDALRFEKILRGDTPVETEVPYYQQTTDFTCGAACLMMALHYFKPEIKMTPVLEIRLWRHATTVFMLSGMGGCEPFGLAVEAHRSGLKAEIFVSDDAFLFLKSVRDPKKRKIMELAQTDFRNEAKRLKIPVNNRAFMINDIRAAIAQGAVVLVLISFYHILGQKIPHWVLAHGDDGRHILIHDPWVEEEDDETVADTANLPLNYEIFDKITRYGKNNLRAAVVLEKN